MVKAEIAKRDRGNKIEYHDAPADKLVRAERLHQHRKHSEQQHVDCGRQDVPGEVLFELQVEIALRKLNEHRSDNRNR